MSDSGPKHSLAVPRGHDAWSVVGTLLPAKPPVLRRLGVGALELFILLFGSDDRRAAS